MVWYSHLFKNFSQFLVIHTIKGSGIVNKAEVDVFWNSCHFFNDPTDVGNLISAFSKSSFNIWKFTVHMLLKPGLENFEFLENFTILWENYIYKTKCQIFFSMFTATLFPTTKIWK